MLATICSFQFHEGPIKTQALSNKPAEEPLFQFHEGPIKTETYGEHSPLLRGFNSMKVRLKQHKEFRNRVAYTVSIP